MSTDEETVRVVVRHLLSCRSHELADSGNIPALEAAIFLCHTFGFEKERERFVKRLLDEGCRIQVVTEVPSPLVMVLSGFFGLSPAKFAANQIRTSIRKLIPAVRSWWKAQMATFALYDLSTSLRPKLLHGFTNRLRCRRFLRQEGEVERMDGFHLTPSHVSSHGLDRPLVMINPIASGFMLNPLLDQETILRELGAEYPVNMIDVAAQEASHCALGDFLAQFNLPAVERDKVLNLISLNVSETRLASYFRAPDFLRALDWANLPGKVRRCHGMSHYILISQATSFTDFHIDLSGSTAWIYVKQGEKIFYLVEPTPRNLDLFETWAKCRHQGRVFFPSLTGGYLECRVGGGELVVIPGGWIHAVYTPVDSFSVGGNLLQTLSAKVQLRCHHWALKKDKYDEFLFPGFRDLQEKALEYHSQQLLNGEGHTLSRFELEGLEALLQDALANTEDGPPLTRGRQLHLQVLGLISE